MYDSIQHFDRLQYFWVWFYLVLATPFVTLLPQFFHAKENNCVNYCVIQVCYFYIKENEYLRKLSVVCDKIQKMDSKIVSRYRISLNEYIVQEKHKFYLKEKIIRISDWQNNPLLIFHFLVICILLDICLWIGRRLSSGTSSCSKRRWLCPWPLLPIY